MDPDDDVEVRLEDQQHINAFGRLNGRMHELEDDLKKINSDHELLDDAANELILADDDEPVRCGSAACARRCTRRCTRVTLQSSILLFWSKPRARLHVHVHIRTQRSF